MKREVSDCNIKDRDEYFEKLGLEKIDASKDADLNESTAQNLEETEPQFRAWKTAWENRKFEIEMYWRRAAYFWAFIAAIYTAFFNVVKMCVERQNECNTLKCFQAVMLVVLAFLGFVFCLGFFLQSIGSKQWQTNWETHVDLLEDEAVGNLYKIFVQAKKKNFSVTKINEWLCRALTFCSVIVFVGTVVFVLDIKIGEEVSNIINIIVVLVLLFAVIVIFICVYKTNWLKGNVVEKKLSKGKNDDDICFVQSEYK